MFADLDPSVRSEMELTVKDIQSDIDSIVLNVKTVIAKTCKLVEKLSNSSIKGSDKKRFAIEILNDYIDIAYMPEFLEDKLISYLIEKVVEVANKHGWSLDAKDMAELMEDE